MKRVKFKFNHWFLRRVFPWATGMTLGHTILFKYPESHYVGRRTVAHELEHVRQIEREGLIKFYVKYLWYNIRYGYRNNPYEVAARRAENAMDG